MTDTSNRFGVALSNNGIIILIPPRHMSNDAAINLAAWLLILAGDVTLEKANEILKEVLG
jgi:hypothetical protein